MHTLFRTYESRELVPWFCFSRITRVYHPSRLSTLFGIESKIKRKLRGRIRDRYWVVSICGNVSRRRKVFGCYKGRKTNDSQ